MKRSREPNEETEGPDFSPAPLFPAVGVDFLRTRPGEDKDDEAQPASKVTELDESAVDETTDAAIMRCSLPPHRDVLSFKTYADYEVHYTQAHSHRCLECAKNFPSQHLLGVHIEDCHDAFAAVRREKGEHTYSCFVEDCERKCRTHQKRRMHLIDKHMYPKNYFFGVTKDGIDGRQSLLLESGHRRRRSSTISTTAAGTKSAVRKQGLQRTVADHDAVGVAATSEMPDVNSKPSLDEAAGQDSGSRDVDMDDLTGAMSSLKFVPSSVRFGRGGRKTGFSKG